MSSRVPAYAESRSAAADTRHRVPYPNSKPRRIRLIGLGEGGRAIAHAAADGLPHVALTELPLATAAASADAVLRETAARAGELERALSDADMIFVTVTPGDDVAYASAIARVARHRSVLVTGVIIDPGAGRSGVGDQHLDDLRRSCDVLVIAAAPDALTGMLAALGA